MQRLPEIVAIQDKLLFVETNTCTISAKLIIIILKPIIMKITEFFSQKPDSPLPVAVSETKKEEQKADLSEAEKTAVGREILGELIDDVITSDTTQPSVPGIVLDTINDIIMSEVALAKEGAAKEKEEREKEEEKQKKDQEKKKKEEEKKKKKQPGSPPPPVTPVPKSPSSPKSPATHKPPEQPTVIPAKQEIEAQEAKVDVRLEDDQEHRHRTAETPTFLPTGVPGTEPSPGRTQSHTEPNITINGQNVPQDLSPVVLNGHVISGHQNASRRQDSRESVASSQASSRRSGSHTPTTPTTPTSPSSEDQRPQYSRATSQDSRHSSASTGKVCLRTVFLS